MNSRRVLYFSSRYPVSQNFGFLSKMGDELMFLNSTLHEASTKYLKDRIHNEAKPFAQKVYSFIVGKKNLEKNKQIRDYTSEAQKQMDDYSQNVLPGIIQQADAHARKSNLGVQITDRNSLESAIDSAGQAGNKDLADKLSGLRASFDETAYKLQNAPKLVKKYKKSVNSKRSWWAKGRQFLGDQLRAAFKYGPEYGDRAINPVDTIREIYGMRLMPQKVRDAYYMGHSLITPLQMVAPHLYVPAFNMVEQLKAPFKAAVGMSSRIPKLGQFLDWAERKTTFTPKDPSEQSSIYDTMKNTSGRSYKADEAENLRQDNLFGILNKYGGRK